MQRPLSADRPDAALWYDPALPLKLGCSACPDFWVCGGLRIAAGVLDCRSLCSCVRNGNGCSGVCRRSPRMFARRIKEVGGFEFDNVPRFSLAPVSLIPEYVPIIYDGTNRRAALDVGMVALPLVSLFDRRSGTPRFVGRDQLLNAYRLSAATRIVLTGVASDRAIESWWSFPDRPRLIDGLRQFGIEMVTSPNYSLFTDVTRQDNLHNMKRIALTWSEFMAGGVLCALHINARTDTDYVRWSDFVAERGEVSHIAFEFTTGTASPLRAGYHRDHLMALAAQVRRPLHLVLRGGRRHLPQLTAAFASVSMLDAEPYVKTKYRQRARPALGADVEWFASPTGHGEALDALLQHNINVARYSALVRFAWLRADYGHGEAGDVGSLLQARPA